MYQIKLNQSVVDKDIPKLQRAGIDLQTLYKSIKKLQTNPYCNSRAKSGDLHGIRGMDWKRGYRILFMIHEELKEVDIISIDHHDEAYRKVKNRIS